MSPSEEYAFVDQFNWDDELEPVKAVLQSESCALETALLAFWRADGPSLYLEETTEDETCGRFASWLAARIQEGFYQSKLGGFDLASSEGVSKTQIYKLRKAGLPEVFFGSTENV